LRFGLYSQMRKESHRQPDQTDHFADDSYEPHRLKPCAHEGTGKNIKRLCREVYCSNGVPHQTNFSEYQS